MNEYGAMVERYEQENTEIIVERLQYYCAYNKPQRDLPGKEHGSPL